MRAIQSEQRETAIGPGVIVERIKLKCAIKVGERVVLVLHAGIDRSAIEKKDSIVGIDFERTVEIGQRALRLVLELVDKTAIGVDGRLVRGELDTARLRSASARLRPPLLRKATPRLV